MEEIQIFNNPQFGEVRVAEVNGEPMFCLADVCSVVKLTNPSNVKSRLDKEDTQLIDLHALSGNDNTIIGNSMATFINETAFYDVLLYSSSDNVKPFRHWVTHEVLPSIRKHGAYMTERTLEQALLNPDYLIQLATKLKEEQQRNKELEAVNKIQAPKAAFTDAVIASNSSCLIGELAKILTQNGYQIGQNRLFSMLRETGYLGTRGEYYNMPNQQYVEQGLFEIKKSVHSENGVMKTASTPKVTGKGQVYFVNKFLGV